MEKDKKTIDTDSSYTHYPDLAPTDDAEHVNPYILRLNDLLINRSEAVKEIAITSPYSGGKSSFIRTFLARNTTFNAIQISLSSFSIGRDAKHYIDSKDDDVEVPEDINHFTSMARVEKSILQQLLYRPSSETTPNSRFRRIFPRPLSDSSAWFYAISVTAWFLIVFSILRLDSLSFEGLLLSIKNQPGFIGAVTDINTWILTYLVGLPLLIVRDSLKHINQLTISKISPLKGEVSLEKKGPESIFNKYLEEIIYFFSVQKTEVVIFEDLDRFSNAIIFEKLKELNKLINDSSDVEADVRFIYAIKDDVFTGSDRTKFFDAIIPIIPFATSANSFPELKKAVYMAGIEEKLKDEFLRDISVFLDDMRVIKNIVSEYILYRKVLLVNLPDLERTKLFSFVVYKNMYSGDFAKLTANTGILYQFIQELPETKELIAASLKTQVDEAYALLKRAKSETAESIETLNARVFFILSEKLGNNNLLIRINSLTIMEAIEEDNFDSLLASNQQVSFSSSNGNINIRNSELRLPHNSTMKMVIAAVFPEYEIRRQNILNKQRPYEAELEERIFKLEKQLFIIRKMSISNLFEKYRDTLTKLDCFSSDEKNGPDLSLLIYMLERGYIDEHYHYYVSHFREGSVSSNDIKFVRSVKKQESIDLDFVPFNISETLKYFDSNDYGSKSFFNIAIVNYFTDTGLDSELLQHFEFAFEDAYDLIDLIVLNAKKFNQVSAVVLLVVRARSNLINELLKSHNSSDKVLNSFFMFLLSALDSPQLDALDDIKSMVNYLSNQEQIYKPIQEFEIDIHNIFSKLQKLDVKFASLHDCKSDTDFLKNVLVHQTFCFNIQNLEILCWCLFENTLCEKSSLTIEQIFQIEDKTFRAVISKHLNDTAQMVLAEDIRCNDFEELRHFLLSDKVDETIKYEIVEQLDFVVKRLDECIQNINPDLINQILQNGKVVPDYEILDFLLDTKGILKEALASYISEFGDLLSNDSKLKELQNKSELKTLLLSSDLNLEVFKLASEFITNDLTIEDVCGTSDKKAEFLIERDTFEGNVENFNRIYSGCGNAQIAHKFLIINFNRLQDDLPSLHLNTTDFYSLLDKVDSEFPKYAKQLLVKAKHSELLDLGCDNANLIKCLSHDENASDFEPFKVDLALEWSIFWELLNSLKEEKSRVLFFLGQISFLDDNSVMRALQFIDAELHEKIANKKRPSKKYTQHTFLLGKGLEYIDVIASARIEEKVLLGKEVRFYTKRVD